MSNNFEGRHAGLRVGMGTGVDQGCAKLAAGQVVVKGAEA
jgi:hypothetical protein